jgi:hypothetical protein
VLLVIAGSSFETGFESDVCRYLHDDPAIRFVTAGLKNFSATGFFDPSRGSP